MSHRAAKKPRRPGFLPGGYREALYALLTLLAWTGLAHDGLHEQIGRLTASIAEQPNDASLHFRLAETYCQHVESESALKELAETDRLAPGKFPTDLLRGDALLQAGKAAESRAALERVLAAQPEHPRARLLHARAAELAGDSKAALDDYRFALERSNPPDPDLLVEAVTAFSFHGREDEALATLDRGIEKLGPIPALVIRALDLDLKAKRFDAALARVDRVQARAPRPEPWMATRARILTQASRTTEARAAWQALLDRMAGLPPLERGSHALSVLAEQAREACAALDSLSSPTNPNAPPVPSTQP